MRFWRDEDGSALLEGALIIPVLFALVMGTLEFSYIFYEQHLVSTGVRDAARYLARTADPNAAAAQTAAQNLASTGSIAGGSARRIYGFDPSEVVISFSTVANPLDPSTGQRPYREATPVCGGPNAILIINVTGSFTHSALGFLAYFGFSPPNIVVTQSERCIGLG
jgi:Flp pilus assembly pilin Flp